MYVYIPEYAGPKGIEALRSVGLETLHDDGRSLEHREILNNGPDGRSGILFGWGALGKMTAYLPASQEWIRCTPCGDLPGGRAWIGWDKDAPPSPETLARKKQLAGEHLLLADGREWLIPVAQHLPKLMKLSQETGQVTSVVAPQYKAFLQDAWNTLAKFMERDGEVYIDYQVGFSAAVRVLAMNYRICRDLADALGILGDNELWTIPSTACECAAMLDLLQKKSLSASDFIASGAPG